MLHRKVSVSKIRVHPCSSVIKYFLRSLRSFAATSLGCASAAQCSFASVRGLTASPPLSPARAIIGLLAMALLQPQTLSAAESESKTNRLTSLSDYHLADADLKIVRIDSDPTESFL